MKRYDWEIKRDSKGFMRLKFHEAEFGEFALVNDELILNESEVKAWGEFANKTLETHGTLEERNANNQRVGMQRFINRLLKDKEQLYQELQAKGKVELWLIRTRKVAIRQAKRRLKQMLRALELEE